MPLFESPRFVARLSLIVIVLSLLCGIQFAKAQESVGKPLQICTGECQKPSAPVAKPKPTDCRTQVRWECFAG